MSDDEGRFGAYGEDDADANFESEADDTASDAGTEVVVEGAEPGEAAAVDGAEDAPDSDAEAEVADSDDEEDKEHGSDSEGEEGEGREHADDGDDTVSVAPSVAASASSRATPQHHRVRDPVLRIANKPRVIRIVPPEDRVTDSRLHKTEASQIISMRAEQISKSAKYFTDAEGLHDPVSIATKELLDRRCPLTLRRTVFADVNETVVEEWNPREMTLPPLTIAMN